ncbi:MAG: hypothetical protein ACRCVX_16020 [Shewanella sp.]
MKKFIAVVAISLVATGCSIKPAEMTTPELCQEYGRSMAAGDVDSAIFVEGHIIQRNNISMAHCKMYAQQGANRYAQGMAQFQRGLQQMADAGY